MKEYPQHRFSVPPGATEILLVRHGESRAAVAETPFPLVEGQGDPELSHLGKAQALRVAERFCHAAIDVIYVTSLQRTVETAAPLAERLGIETIIEPELREVHLGEWEGGLFRIKAYENDPIYRQMQIQQRWDLVPGAESLDHLRHRVGTALNKIIKNHQDELVVAVLHGGVIGHILAEATGSEAFAFNDCDNASVSHIVAIDNKIILRGFNDVTHLAGLKSAAMPT